MKEQQQKHNIEVEQQGQKSTSLVGDQAQLFQVEGDLYYQEAGSQEAQQPVFPPSPIPDPGIFSGREYLLSDIEQFFRQNSAKVFLLEGMGGTGKTVFAAYICRKFRQHFQDIFWETCLESSNFERFSKDLSGFFARTEEIRLNSMRNETGLPLQTQMHVLLQKLGQQHYLLVFDDFQVLLDHSGRIRNPDVDLFFRQLIQGGHQSKLLLISRRSIVLQRQPAGVSIRKRIIGLKLTSARTLLNKLGMPLSPEQFRALYNKIGGHPLVLRILADLYDRGFPLQQLLTTPFRELSRESGELCNDLFSDVWKIIKSEDIEVLRWLSTYRRCVPLEAINIFGSKPRYGQESFSHLPSLQTIVRFLNEHCLINVKKTRYNQEVYTVPHIIREFVFRGLTKQVQQEYHARVANYLVSSGEAKHPLTLEELREQKEAIYHFCRADQRKKASKLALSLSDRLCRCGLGEMAKTVLLKTARADLSDEDLATGYNHLGNVCVLQGNYSQALRHYKRAYAIHQRLGSEKELAMVDNNIGTVYAFSGEYSFALIYYEKARKILKRLQLQEKLATCYNNIGCAYASLGKNLKALAYHEQALEIQESLKLDVDLANTYNNIGFIYDCYGDHNLALSYYEQARKIQERLGLEVDLAASYNNIGGVYAAQNEFDKALHYYTQAQEILERLKLEVNLARSYNNIGILYTKQGEFALALQHYEQAREIQERLGLRVDLAQTYNNIGLVYASRRSVAHHVHALEYYERAREIQEQLGLEAPLAITLGNMGHIYYHQGEYKKAEQVMNRVIEVRKKLNLPGLENDMALLKQIRRALTKRSDRIKIFLKRFKRRLWQF